MLAVTASRAVSMTLTLESPSLLAYTMAPSGVITRPCGPAGTGMVVSSALVEVSITAMALSLNRPTYALGPAACAVAATDRISATAATTPAHCAEKPVPISLKDLIGSSPSLFRGDGADWVVAGASAV